MVSAKYSGGYIYSRCCILISEQLISRTLAINWSSIFSIKVFKVPYWRYSRVTGVPNFDRCNGQRRNFILEYLHFNCSSDFRNFNVYFDTKTIGWIIQRAQDFTQGINRNTKSYWGFNVKICIIEYYIFLAAKVQINLILTPKH